MQFRVMLTMAALAGGIAILAACTSPAPPPAPPPPQPAAVIEESRFVAVVDSVNQRTREVVVRGPEGNRVTVTAGPEVQNLAQVRRGDRVVVTYGEALAVEMAPPGVGGPPVEITAAAARARPGQRPAGAAGQEVRARVRIEAVDPVTGRVAFIGPQGVRRVVAPQDPGMANFARQLRPGDEVDVTFAEAVAIRVEPAER
jgi:hypothetical protein